MGISENGRSSFLISLIRPPYLKLKNSLSVNGAVPPLGLAYIAAVLRETGHLLEIIDAIGDAPDVRTEIDSPVGTAYIIGVAPDEIVERINPNTRLVAISHMFITEWPLIKALAAKIKQRLPDAYIVLGGENATSYWETIFKESSDIDFCVLGEGELTIVRLAQALIDGDVVGEIPGIAALRAETPKDSSSNTLSKRIPELSEVPWPAWDLFPMENYLKRRDGIGANRGRSLPILATRGCPYRCTFCSSPSMWTTKYVVREPTEVVEEMKAFIARYRIQNFNFFDLTAVIKKKWFVEFCNTLKNEKLNITWQMPVGTRSEALDRDVLKLAYETGCTNITYAPESGSDRLIKKMKKKVNLSNMLQSMRWASELGFVVRVNIILGHPQENRSDILDSFRLAIRCALVGCRDIAVIHFVPYPGSEDTRELVRNGSLSLNDKYCYEVLTRSSMISSSYNTNLSKPELFAYWLSMSSIFYAISYSSHPERIYQMFSSLVSGRGQTQVDSLLMLMNDRITSKVSWLTEGVRSMLTRDPGNTRGRTSASGIRSGQPT